MIRAIFFDLDGTLIDMDEPKFDEIYFGSLIQHLAPYGYDPLKVKEGIYNGVAAMMMNDSGLTNEDIFWATFNKFMGRDCKVDLPIFDEYYKTKFHVTKAACGANPLSKKIVEFCRENFEILVLSTNPLFPELATNYRMSISGLKPSDFDFVTTYENSYHCKPNPKYFIDLMNKFNLKPEEVFVVGNNNYEDSECALMCGIKSVLLKGNIIYNDKATHTFEEIECEDLIDYLKALK